MVIQFHIQHSYCQKGKALRKDVTCIGQEGSPYPKSAVVS